MKLDYSTLDVIKSRTGNEAHGHELNSFIFKSCRMFAIFSNRVLPYMVRMCARLCVYMSVSMSVCRSV